MELFELGIKAAREGIAKGEFSSVELTQAVIDRCHAKNAEIVDFPNHSHNDLFFDQSQVPTYLKLMRQKTKRP